MINPNISTGVHALTTRECLVELSNLIPKSEASISHLTDPQKAALQGMIADLLQKVHTNEKSFTFEQRANLMNIRTLAKRAEQMHLLSKEGEAAIQGIASKTKEIGLSLYASPRDAKLETTDGPVEVNSDVLKENSDVFKNMFEAANGIDIPVDLPEKTVDFLMKCLHAPETKPIELPEEKGMIPGLLRFAAGYGFNTLIQKLEPAITQFLKANPNALATHTDDWLSAFHLVNQTHPEAAGKWFDVITPCFLEKSGIPVKPSGLPGLFEVSKDHLNAFLNEPTRDVLKYLPLVVEIRDEKDLDHFLTTIQTTKLTDPLPIKLLCRMSLSPNEEKSLQQLTKASNINLDIEKIFIPPGTVVFGKELWDTYLGEVEDVPLPAGIGELLESDFIVEGPNGELIDSGKKWKDKFMLFLMPKTVDGEPLTLNSFRELSQHPKGEGHAANYGYTYAPILEEHGNNAVERSDWVLMSMEVIEGSRNLPYAAQEALVAAIPGCEVPDLLSAHVGILTHFIHTGERLYGQDPLTYSRCKETVLVGNQRCQTVVGGFGAAGLDVDSSDIDFAYDGVGALRKFVS